MKTSLRFLLIGTAALAMPQMASASLVLAGWHDFDANTTDETADVAISGFSGSSVSKGGVASKNNTGSQDGIYGGADPNGDSNQVGAATLLDGSLVLNSTNTDKSLVFTVWNQSGQDYVIDGLQFDAARVSNASLALGKVQYQVNEGGYTDVAPYGTGILSYSLGGNSTTDSVNPIYSNDFTDIDINYLISVLIPSGSTVDFKIVWTSGVEQRIDNVSVSGNLSAIPEPGSLLALGCLVGSGALLRTRRRKA